LLSSFHCPAAAEAQTQLDNSSVLGQLTSTTVTLSKMHNMPIVSVSCFRFLKSVDRHLVVGWLFSQLWHHSAVINLFSQLPFSRPFCLPVNAIAHLSLFRCLMCWCSDVDGNGNLGVVNLFSNTREGRLYGLVVWVPGYRSRGLGFDSRRCQIFRVVCLEGGPLSDVSTIEELLERKSSGCSLESREYGRVDSLRWLHDSRYQQKLALTSPTSGGRSIGIVRSRTQDMEFSIVRTLRFHQS
jgi:hypothetical protein